MRKRKNQHVEEKRILTIVGILAVLIIFFAVVAKGFVSRINIYNLFQQMTIIGIITVGQMFVITSGGIDLTQGVVIGLVTLMSARIIAVWNMPILVGILAAIAIGIFVGFINGYMVAYIKLPPFIVTLGMSTIIEAIALLSNNGSDIYGLPPQISRFAQLNIGGVMPVVTIFTVIIAVLGYILLKRTSYGRSIYAVGSSEDAARFSGIKVEKTLLFAYILDGFLLSIAGLIMLCKVNGGMAAAGKAYEMNAISAVVIGGGSLSGGEGTMGGSLLGAMIITVVANGLQIMGVSSYMQKLITGIILIGAVLMDTLKRRKER